MTREAVIDCSATGPWILPDERTAECEQLLTAVRRGELNLSVPPLWIYETLNLLRTAVHRGRLDRSAAEAAWALLAALPLNIAALPPDDGREILAAALARDLTAYDAAYFQLAAATGRNLITLDDRLLRLGRRHDWIRSPAEFLRAGRRG